MKTRVVSKAIVPEGTSVTVVDGLISFCISDNVVTDDVSTWLDLLLVDEATTYPFIINVFDIDGPLLIENENDLKSYADTWDIQHEEEP